MTEIDICNLALSHVGDEATVTSINPPEGSAQAEHCQRFYAVARDAMLEMHAWSFASRRVALAEVTQPWPMWLHGYAAPSDMMTAVAVLAPDAGDDLAAPSTTDGRWDQVQPLAYTPQPFVIETDSAGAKVILTNQEDAVLRYQAAVTEAGSFSPLFAVALSHHLAAMLAGAVIKGQEGAAEAKRQSQMMFAYLQQARAADSAQRRVEHRQQVGWISGR